MTNITIRPESPGDFDAVRTINEAAFGQPAEAELVDTLRTECGHYLSLAAEVDGAIVGHILFTPAHVASGGATLEGMGLAPMAVAPGHQRSGIGSALVNAGLEQLRADGCPFVIVLGHPGYYPRFGFSPASAIGIRCQWEAPDEAFMVLELKRGALAPFHGSTARYHPAFDSVV